MSIPIIDDRIRIVGILYLRGLNKKKLKEMKEMLIIQDGDKPLVVIVPFQQYLDMQKELMEGRAAIERESAKLTHEIFGAGFAQPIDDTANGGTNQNPDMEHSQAGFREPDTTAPYGHHGENPAPHGQDHIQIPPPAPTAATCSHCGNASAQSPCAACFSSGHRAGPRCFKCVENEEVRRRAAQDATGGERDDIDRLAFDREVS